MALWDTVQHASDGVQGSSGASQVVSFGSDVTAGNFIVVTAVFHGTGLNLSCSDTINGSTYTRVVNQETQGFTHAVFHKFSAGAGATTVTVTGGSAVSTRSVSLGEFDEAGNAISIDINQTANAASGNSPTTGATSTRATASQLMYGSIGFGGLSDPTVGTNVAWVDHETNANILQVETFVAASAGTQAATWTQSFDEEWNAAILTFRVGGASSSSVSPSVSPSASVSPSSSASPSVSRSPSPSSSASSSASPSVAPAVIVSRNVFVYEDYD